MYTQEQIDLIISAQEKQIKNPARAVVNSECSYVKFTISKIDPKLASEYWNWVCYIGHLNDPTLFGEKVCANELELARIDAEQTMPDWGYADT
jgi:hypothetical protein